MRDENRIVMEKAWAKAIDYKRTFGSEHGKRVLHDMMQRHHMLDVFRGDPAELQFREGERFVVLMILNRLKLDIAKLKLNFEEMEQNRE